MIGDPYTKKGQILGAQCLMCKHFNAPKDDPENRPRCAAFPDGIPDEIYNGKPPMFLPDPHNKPTEWQKNDVIFEPDTEDGVDQAKVDDWNRMWVMLADMYDKMSQGEMPTMKRNEAE